MIAERKPIVALAKDLIRVPSVAGNSQAMSEVLTIVQKELAGFSCEEFSSNGVKSLLFFNRHTRPDTFKVILNGHLDVVSGKDEQFQPVVRRGRLYGRGSQDMKSTCAALIQVFKQVADTVSYPIGLQLVTDEEDGGYNGTKYQIEQGVRSDFVISGEPTDLTINNEHKGSLGFEVTFAGKSAHVGYLEQGDNAVVKMAKFVTNVANAYPLPESGEWKTTASVSWVDTTNRENNKVPADATAVLGMRFVRQDDPDLLEESLRAILPNGSALRRIAQGVPSYTDPNDPRLQLLAKIIQEVTGKTPKFTQMPWGSDSRHFVATGAKVIDFGPIGFGMHSDEEYIDIKSLEKYEEILKRFLLSLK